MSQSNNYSTAAALALQRVIVLLVILVSSEGSEQALRERER